jgi:hypothetical protein
MLQSTLRDLAPEMSGRFDFVQRTSRLEDTTSDEALAQEP